MSIAESLKKGTHRPHRPGDLTSNVQQLTWAFVRRNRWDIGTLFLFAILTMVVTYPLVFHLSSRSLSEDSFLETKTATQ